jgi:hypothetical protein
MGDMKSPLRLMKDARKLLPAAMLPRSGIAPSLWQRYRRIKLAVSVSAEYGIHSHFIATSFFGMFASYLGAIAHFCRSTLYKDFSTTNPMYFLKVCNDKTHFS